MKTIWIINQYGPIEGENWRDYSYNQISKYLSARGEYEVIWWTSNFAHHFKKYRSKGWKDIQISKNYIIRLVPTTSYKKNFGIGRLIRDWTYAINAKKRFQKEEAPDLIITSMLPMSFGEPTFSYANSHNIPYILNTMDIWPEFIENNLGRFSKIAHVLFLPVYKKRRDFYHKASALIALGKNYLEFAKNISPNGRSIPSELVYNGIDVDQFQEMLDIPVKKELLDKINVEKEKILCIFAGTFGPSYDVDTMLSCASKCEKQKINIKFIFAGSGPRVNDVSEFCDTHNNSVFLGSLKPNELIPIYNLCDIGLCAYTEKSNVDMPDKFYDYCAAGLATINSLTEEVATYVEDEGAGINYKAGDSDSLFNAVYYFANNSEALIDAKKKAKQLSTIFDSKVQNAKLEKLIRQLI